MSTNSVTIHPETSPLAGQSVTVDLGHGETEYRVEDWWDRVSGQSWMFARGNPACLNFAMRTAMLELRGAGVPTNDEVLYGHTKDGLGHLVHVTEIKTEVSA